MREEHVTEQLPAYTLGILERDEQAAVAEHVATCPSCQADLAAYQTMVAASWRRWYRLSSRRRP
jgi:anti-sigma factor RsiW